MSIENEIQDLTQSTTDLLNAVNTKKVTLDNAVSQAQTAVTDATSQVSLAAAEKVGAQTARDEAETHKNQAYTYSQSAASAVAYQDLTAIAQTKAESAVDVFVYDTSKDSDGGAWRQRTQHTSWYNEPLNTSTRGGRKEFPAVAVIVAETDKVTIYDGDDPSLPMWMVFQSNTNSMIRSNNISSCVIINGELYVGLSTADLHCVSFIKDTSKWITASSAYGGTFSQGGISQRNQSATYGYYNAVAGINDTVIINANVNDVAMTVLPDAPIDPATGLPIPTIAVATDGGVSVIKDDGTVVDSGSDNVRWVMFGGTDTLYFEFSNSSKYINIKDITNDGWTGYDMAESLVTTPIYAHGTVTSRKNTVIDKNTIAVGVNTSALAGLGIYSKTKNDINYGSLTNLGLDEGYKQAIITSKYNTGWMNGDIKLATLSDTDDTDLVGSELVTNGTFATDTSGWDTYASQTTLSVENGRLKAVRDNQGTWGASYYSFPSVAGKTYKVTATIEADANNSVALYFRGSSSASPTTPNIHETTMFSNAISVGEAKTVTAYFQAYDVYTHVHVMGNVGDIWYIDNVSITEAEPDRSVNNNGLQVFGTVQKNPVATGADLVAYSGFSSSNYLEQPYNPDLDFGTGDYCIMAWVKPSDNTTQYFFDRQDGANSATGRFNFGIGGDKTTIFHRTDSTLLSFNYTSVTGKWTHYTLLRKSGVVYVYVDGQLIGSASNTVDYSSSFNARFFAIGSGLSGQDPDSASLLRISATAPTAEQIERIYQDEKVLFQENAKATLHGTSDAVTALAYDDTTELLHVGTSAGRSVFQGLRRVDNTTDAVGTAISASNGLIVEE